MNMMELHNDLYDMFVELGMEAKPAGSFTRLVLAVVATHIDTEDIAASAINEYELDTLRREVADRDALLGNLLMMYNDVIRIMRAGDKAEDTFLQVEQANLKV